MAKLLGTDSPRSLTLATLFGVASSSCSYAAVALARSIFRKGASFTNAMVFEIASTNLVIELGIILIVLMGWQFAAAEFVGGIVMVVFIALIMRLTLTPRLRTDGDRRMRKRERSGRMEGHAAMDMSVQGARVIPAAQWSRLHGCESSLCDGLGVGLDRYLGGFLIAGALAAWVPQDRLA